MSKIVIDSDRMTLGDIETFEEMVGERLETLEDGRPSGKALVALVYITKRRDDPNYTVEDARKVPVSDLADEEEEADPTEAVEAAAS